MYGKMLSMTRLSLDHGHIINIYRIKAYNADEYFFDMIYLVYSVVKTAR